MNDNATDNTGNVPENTDNMAQNNEAAENAMSNEEMTNEFETLATEIESETDKVAAELNDIKDKYVRLVAEFDNFRRRNAKENNELRATAGKDVIISLLAVMDDADRAQKQMESTTDIEVLKEGVSLVFNKLRSIMQQKGLKKMEGKNETFSADLHEAITEIPAPTPKLVGKVVDVIEPGYYLNDKLIRHAKVVVGK